MPVHSSTVELFRKPNEDRQRTYQQDYLNILAIDPSADSETKTSPDCYHLLANPPGLSLGLDMIVPPRKRENRPADRVEMTQCLGSDVAGFDGSEFCTSRADSSREYARALVLALGDIRRGFGVGGVGVTVAPMTNPAAERDRSCWSQCFRVPGRGEVSPASPSDSGTGPLVHRP